MKLTVKHYYNMCIEKKTSLHCTMYEEMEAFINHLYDIY